MTKQPSNFCRRTRREFLWQSGAGFGSVALSGLLDGDGFFPSQALAADGTSPYKHPLSAHPPHNIAKAKAVIFLFMYGGPSHIDTFDYKPKLVGMEGKSVAVNTWGRGGKRQSGRIVEPRWKFKQHGQSGKQVSTLFPHIANHVDDIAFLHSMTADSPIHGSALFMMNSGRIASGSPALGSWVTYGLGSENKDLPGFVVLLDKTGGPINGAKNWSSGYMPGSHQGTVFNTVGAPVLNLQPVDEMGDPIQRDLLDSIQRANHDHLTARTGNQSLAARIASFELAYRMQSTAPEAVDFSTEQQHTLNLYGLDDKRTAMFGRKCLLARRLVERGVRFIQVYSGGAHENDNWDAHGGIESNHNHHAGATDKPIAGLLQDLKDRGLLNETLVVWGGEFGRQPTAEYAKGSGRDHNSFGFTMWLAGGGIHGGISLGATDDLGSAAVERPIQVSNLHATILYQLGLDPNHLTYFHAGLDQKLVGVEPVQPIHEIIT